MQTVDRLHFLMYISAMNNMLQIRIPRELVEIAKEAARAEGRTLQKYVEFTLRAKLCRRPTSEAVLPAGTQLSGDMAHGRPD